jgi:hypothetical protein
MTIARRITASADLDRNGTAQGDPPADAAESCARPAAAVPDMAALHIEILHRMVLASADIAENLRAQVAHRAALELRGEKAEVVPGSDPAMVYTHVQRCLRHSVALAQRLERERGQAPEPEGAAGRRNEPDRPAKPDPKEAAKADALAVIEERIRADGQIGEPEELLDAMRETLDTPEYYDALGEEPLDRIVGMVMGQVFSALMAEQSRPAPTNAAAGTAQTPEETSRDTAAAAEQARRQAETEHILAIVTAAIKTDPGPADYGERQSRIGRLEQWLGRAAMRARIGQEPSAGIIRDLRAGLGLALTGAPEEGQQVAANGHDPP